MPNMIHDLKCWTPFYDDILSGRKTFEWRINDRGFQVGDVLRLKEYDQAKDQYTGRVYHAVVRYMIEGGQFGIPDEYCIMGI